MRRKFNPRHIDYQTAVRRLTKRWHEQGEQHPATKQEMPLATYIRANAFAVMRNDLLRAYD
jgi:hypothetical protein